MLRGAIEDRGLSSYEGIHGLDFVGEARRVYAELVSTGRLKPGGPFRVLDWGCGRGAFLMGLRGELRKEGIPVQVFGTTSLNAHAKAFNERVPHLKGSVRTVSSWRIPRSWPVKGGKPRAGPKFHLIVSTWGTAFYACKKYDEGLSLPEEVVLGEAERALAPGGRAYLHVGKGFQSNTFYKLGADGKWAGYTRPFASGR